MKDIINGLIERFRRQHVQARRYVAMMLVLALLTTLFVNWQLHGVGISMTADYHCGYEEHQHTAACYEKVLTCGYEEGEPETPVTSSDSSADPVSAYSAEEPEEPVQTEPETIWVPHEHTDACYEEHRVLTCYQEEHEHTDDCFDEYGALICGEFEHIHDDSCYTTEYELVCGLDEGELVEEPNPAYQEMPASRPVVDLPTEPAETTPDEPVLHHHTDACYTEELVCTIPEHHHTVECLADTQADVETAEEWQAAANVALNGNWAEDLLTVAKSQLDYQQSDKNFKLDVEDQQVLRGYSRYGAWYGNPYGAWDVMFLSYCLHFAGVPQTVVPQRAGVMALHSDLRGSQWLTDADGSTARPGDIVIYNTLTTEQVAVDESSYGIALLDLDEDPDTAAQLTASELTASEPQVDTRTVTTETVGVVSAVDPDAGTLTVISGNVDGKVAEVPAAMSDVTSVISVTGAYAAETTAAAPEDPAGSQEKLDGSYALLEDEEGFGATVDWVGDADPYGIALLAAGDDHDLKTWITDVNYEKTTDGKTWTSIGAGSVTVDSGTHVRVNLKYTVKPGVLTPTNNTLTYQLPKGLPMPDVVTGNIVDESDKDKAGNAKVVGSFTVDTDGKVTLTFTDEKFIGTDEKGGLPFTGTFKAAVTASADNFEDEKEIKFKDDCILTIKKKTADIKISKGSGSPLITNRKDGTFVNNYEVTVGTTNGTKDPVILTDTLNTNRNGENRSDYLKGGKYLVDSFKLYKVDASGTKTEIDVPAHELKTDGNGNPQVVLAPLPALEAGEKYIWNYDVQRDYADFDKMPNGVAIINNTAKAEAGRNVKDAADAWYTCKTSRIEKKGEYDPKTGRIQWTITVKVPHSFLGPYLLQGCKITDALPDGVKIVGDVKVGSDTISAEKFLQNGYTIPAGYDGTELKITFETTTPIGGGSVTNKAQILTKSNHTFEASDTVNIGKGDWSLSKSIATRGETPTWNLSATNKAGEAEFTLWDVLDDAENDQGETKEDTHYAIAKELDDAIKANLTLTMHDNTRLTYAQAGNTIEMTYYADRDGTTQVNAGDSSTRVRSFSIHVKAGDDQNPVRSISVTGIPTHEERDDVPTGEVWTYKNFMKIDGVSGNDSAEDTYRSYKKFEKGVAATSSGNETGYLTGNNTFEKNDLGGHKLRYQLVLQTDQDDADAIEVTDILPENVDFAINSVQISLDEDAFVKPDKLTTAKATAAYDPATRQLTVNIKDYNPDANKPHRIRIRYEVDVGTDTQLAWKNPSVGELTYTNSATWGERTETTTTTVTRDVEQVKKTGWQDPGNDRKLHYQVVINPAGEDLSAGQTRAEKIELWDNISTTNGAIATGDINSVKLYFYNYDETVGVTTGKEVPRNMYRILEADKNGWLHMVIPNMAALILVYDCNVKDGSAAASYQVSNTVTLSNGSKSSDSGITYQVKADATATTAQFVLRKKDSYSGVSLEGAEFTIYQYNTVSGQFVPWTGNGTGTLTTDENGQASLAVLNSETASCLKPDVLYKLVETKAPTDYQLDATPHYLLFRKNASAENEQKAFANATGVAEGTTILTVNDETVDLNSNVQVGSDAGTTTAEYSNVYSKLTVSKLWLDADTRQPVEPAAESIDIEVWRYTDDVEHKELFKEATLNAGNKWTKTWSGEELPLTDKESGKAYHYLVEEVTTGNWNVYIDNNGVQTGNITVQNYVYTGYELPSTGGMGTAPFGVLGGALAAAAALLLVRKRKQNEEE